MATVLCIFFPSQKSKIMQSFRTTLWGDVVINDPECTAKTYPRFFDDLERLRS